MEVTSETTINPIYTIKNYTFSYPNQREKALNHLSLSVDTGAFLVICGISGCGKSTLLRQLKSVLTPHGNMEGEIYFQGKSLFQLDYRMQSEKIGFVQQSPDNQIVTDKVWHELAFGLESLGYDNQTIRRRVAEMASFFGIESWFYRGVNELSGGQKQLLNLASVMAMQPAVLILDEPTSQLDPIAAAEFLSVLGKINRELGTTIILTEHRLEEVFPLASQVAVMEEGAIIVSGSATQVGDLLRTFNHPMFHGMPTPMRLWAAVGEGDRCPITIGEGRHWLQQIASRRDLTPPRINLPEDESSRSVLVASQLWYRYTCEGNDIVKGLSLTLHEGEFFALLGGNGTGKTTALKLLAGCYHPYRGDIKGEGRVGMLPQNPQTLFVKKTVAEDLFDVFLYDERPYEEQRQQVESYVKLCRLEGLLSRHPYDLSGGEQQRVALCKILLLDPDILLLDEPTKGLDGEFKEIFASILKSLLERKVAILMVSHDIEFCASYAHRCALFFAGDIVSQDFTQKFFTENSFYTTAANRMSRGIIDGVVTCDDLICACGQTVPAAVAPVELDWTRPMKREVETSPPQEIFPLWRKFVAGISIVIALIIVFQTLTISNLTVYITQTGLSAVGQGNFVQNLALICALGVAMLSISRKSKGATEVTTISKGGHHLPKRTIIATIVILLLIPFTLFVGITYLEGRKYYFIALLILLECMVPFFVIFEGRKPQTRELVTIAVLCAMGVAGRVAFFMLPQFKPVIALCIVAGVAFGGETGFLVGALSMLVSNILFAQGPWTPWQMFAMGIIGFIAGILFQKGFLRPTRGTLATFGAFTAILIYGGLMNVTAALLWSNQLNLDMILAYCITGFPMDLIHGGATFLFLWVAGEPMLEKLERIKLKYGLIEARE